MGPLLRNQSWSMRLAEHGISVADLEDHSPGSLREILHAKEAGVH